MTASRSFLLIQRIVFVLFSLQFLKDAFYKWDGYSYYMRFPEFSPDLCLVFILWTSAGILIASSVWAALYLLSSLLPRSIFPACLEYLIFTFIFILLPVGFKRTFYADISISNFIGLSRLSILIAVAAVAVALFWFIRKDITNFIVKVLDSLNNRITPLVWIFLLVFILALPVSFMSGYAYQKGISHDGFEEVAAVKGTDTVERPNIILVVLDSLTSLDMQVYGYERPTTPFLTDWAGDAIVYNNVYSSSSWTTPATLSMMTGQRVWTHRVWNDVFYRPANSYTNSLPALLKEYGYDNLSFVQNRYAHPYTLGIHEAFSKKDRYYRYWEKDDFLFNRFADIFLDRPIAKTWISDSYISRFFDSYRPPFQTTKAPPEKVFNAFLEHLSKTGDGGIKKPFFAWLHLWAPHFLYLPPEPYMGFFGDADKFNSNQAQWSNFGFNATYPPEKQGDVDILRKRFDEFILNCDKELELFISRLSETIDMSNTIVIVTSDHGESFSHGFLGHAGPHLYESLVRIPLIVKYPEEGRGMKIDMPVEQTDIAPTILEIAGIPVPEWMEGRSLLPLQGAEQLESRPLYSMQFRRNRSRGNPITNGVIAVWDGSYKLVYYIKEQDAKLFNIETDFEEEDDLYLKEPEISGRLKGLIESRLARANREILQGEQL